MVEVILVDGRDTFVVFVRTDVDVVITKPADVLVEAATVLVKAGVALTEVTTC